MPSPTDPLLTDRHALRHYLRSNLAGAFAEDISLSLLEDGTAVGQYLRTELSSVFQTIVDGSNRIAGHEAFVRTHGAGEREITPWNLFSLVADDDALVALDRLCRVVHTINFLSQPDTRGRLFLNVHGRLLAAVRENHGHTFRDALERIGLLPGNIVIETPESANQDRTLLALVLANYRINGFRVAANALDVEDLESVLRVVRPDFVKIDARRLRSDKEATRTYQIARDNGARPVFIRVESAIQRQLLQSLPDTLLQGNAIAKAKALPVDGPVLPPADDYRDHAAAA